MDFLVLNELSNLVAESPCSPLEADCVHRFKIVVDKDYGIEEFWILVY